MAIVSQVVLVLPETWVCLALPAQADVLEVQGRRDLQEQLEILEPLERLEHPAMQEFGDFLVVSEIQVIFLCFRVISQLMYGVQTVFVL